MTPDLRAALAAYEAARAAYDAAGVPDGVWCEENDVALDAAVALGDAAAAHLPGLLEEREAQARLIERLREALRCAHEPHDTHCDHWRSMGKQPCSCGVDWLTGVPGAVDPVAARAAELEALRRGEVTDG